MTEDKQKQQIPVTKELGELIDNYIRQQNQTQMLLQTIIDTAAVALSIPKTWMYDPERHAFIGVDAPPVVGNIAPAGVGDGESD